MAQEKAGCAEEDRGSSDIPPVLDLPTSNKQRRKSSQCSRGDDFDFETSNSRECFCLPLTSSPEEPTILVSIPEVSFSCSDLYKTELMQYVLFAAWLPRWDLLTFWCAVYDVLYPCPLGF